ncbi:hypothetical protein GOV04_01775 [Candidatus Woesearchaeota archaeon]|nr:hypothetical protein [Candidatus Woesearchaeota archaeon]
MSTKNKKNIVTLLAIIIIVFLLVFIVQALTFITPPNIDNNTKSDEDIICTWSASGDTTQTNVTWYNNSVFFRLHIGVVGGSKILEKQYTKRSQTWTCQVTITNTTATTRENATVQIKNADPVSLAMYNQSNNYAFGNSTTMYEDSTYDFYLNATDNDGDTLTYFFDNSINATVTSAGIFSWTPQHTDANDNNVTFFVHDNYLSDLGIDALVFSITIVFVNDAPVFNPALTDKTATEDSLFEYTINATDEETDYPLNFTIIDDNGLIGSDGLGLNITILSGTSAKLYFTPVFGDVGVHVITINISDANGTMRQDTFNLQVDSINHYPFFTYIQNVSATQGNLYTMQVNATDIDVNDTLSFDVEAIGCPLSDPWSITTTINNSANAVGQISQTLTNDHVVCRQIRFSVTDTKVTTYSQNLTLNLTNANDIPQIFDDSYYGINTFNVTNITNQTAYAMIEFRYRVNFSDVDNLTYQGETLTATDNTTLFDINTTTGLIMFTPNSSVANKTHYIEINVSDDEGKSAVKTLVLFIRNNTAPIISPITPNFTINEKQTLYYDVNATDNEGDTITYSVYNTTVNNFTINPSTGLIDFLTNQSMVGNHTITIRATDTLTTYDENTFSLEIFNVNDAPVLNTISFPVVVVNYPFYYDITASDEDLALVNSYENLTFWVSWINDTSGLTHFFNVTKTSNTTANINFTPLVSQIGNYTIRLGVNDSQDLVDWQEINFTIYPQSANPTIENITPHATPTNFSWVNTTLYPQGYTDINVSESATILFNHSTTNPEPNETLSYFWYYDGNLVATTHDYNHYFTFASSGRHNISLRVEDDKYGFAVFLWNLSIANINRPVIYVGDPANLTITSTTTYPNGLYLPFNNVSGVFYDADDDLDGNGQLDLNETTSLNYSYTYYSGQLSSLDILIIGNTVTFTPLTSGTVRYTFSANDGYNLVTTNPVEFTINYTPVTQPEVVIQIVTRTKTKPEYYQYDVEKIVNLDILVPQAVSLYENETAIVPINIKNNGTGTLYGITLSATSQNTELNFSFTNETIERLTVGKTASTELIIGSYRTQGTYEVTIQAKVRNPAFTDSALIVVGSIEKEGDAKSATRTKISYARDLLSTNTECLELNEMLGEVQIDIEEQDYTVAQQKLDELIQTCRYLTSQKELIQENPSIIKVSWSKVKSNSKIYLSVITILIFSIGGVLFSLYYTNKRQE